MDPKKIVAEGYDNIAEQHEKWAGDVRVAERAKYTSVLPKHLPVGAEVLELGCGSGIPTTKELAKEFRVTGVDISSKQIALAKQNIPHASFVHSDMTRLSFPNSSFDAVAAFYSIIHIPRDEKAELLLRIASWLRPGGIMVITMGAHPTEAYLNENFLGKPMYWSNFDSETNRQLVQDAGLQIISAEEETADEFGSPVTFLWIVARM